MAAQQKAISIPEPQAEIVPLWSTTKALKEAVEVLQGIRGNRPAATVEEMQLKIDNLQSQLDAMAQHQGWAFYVDGTYITQGTALQFTADTRAILECDGTSSLSQESQINQMVGIWNTTNDTLFPITNHSYDLRISFKAETATSGANNYFVLDLDIGDNGGIGTGPVILADTRPLIKGQGVEHNYVFSWPLFALDPFPENGGNLFLESNVDLDIWDIRIYIAYIYAPLVPSAG